jgi:hypothetical protein
VRELIGVTGKHCAVFNSMNDVCLSAGANEDQTLSFVLESRSSGPYILHKMQSIFVQIVLKHSLNLFVAYQHNWDFKPV